MPHADSAYLPPDIRTKTEFWDHVYTQLHSLLGGQRTWVTNLANASSLIHNALLAFSSHFGDGERMVNWCGFYIDAPLFPTPSISRSPSSASPPRDTLVLGPFCGKPACQLIKYATGRARGVCADAYLRRHTLVVPDVAAYPGHIACDGETNSEIVIPLLVSVVANKMGHAAEFGDVTARAVGVLDLDCLALEGFNEEDRVGLERIAKLVVESCDW